MNVYLLEIYPRTLLVLAGKIYIALRLLQFPIYLAKKRKTKLHQQHAPMLINCKAR